MIKEDSKKDFLKVLLFWFCVCLLIHFWIRLSIIPIVRNLSPLFIAFLLLYSPTLVFKEAKDFYFYLEKDKEKILYSFKVFFLFSLVVFPIFFAANHFFQAIIFKATYHSFPFFKWSEFNLIVILLNQLLLIALPEEYFFRGFLWDKLKPYFDTHSSLNFFGVALSPLFFFNAFLFAFSHSLIVLQWWHFAIFFPGLAFAWLRQKTQGLLAPILFHAFCNVANFWIAKSYRSL